MGLVRPSRCLSRCACACQVDESVFKVNYFGPVALTKAVLPGMLERKAGHIVAISSVQGIIGLPARTAYSASKHALHGFFDGLRAGKSRDAVVSVGSWVCARCCAGCFHSLVHDPARFANQRS